MKRSLRNVLYLLAFGIAGTIAYSIYLLVF